MRSGRPLPPLFVLYHDIKTDTLREINPEVAELAEARRSTLSPGERVLLSAASQAPVPPEGNIKTCFNLVLPRITASRRMGNARFAS